MSGYVNNGSQGHARPGYVNNGKGVGNPSAYVSKGKGGGKPSTKLGFSLKTIGKR